MNWLLRFVDVCQRDRETHFSWFAKTCSTDCVEVKCEVSPANAMVTRSTALTGWRAKLDFCTKIIRQKFHPNPRRICFFFHPSFSSSLTRASHCNAISISRAVRSAWVLGFRGDREWIKFMKQFNGRRYKVFIRLPRKRRTCADTGWWKMVGKWGNKTEQQTLSGIRRPNCTHQTNGRKSKVIWPEESERSERNVAHTIHIPLMGPIGTSELTTRPFAVAIAFAYCRLMWVELGIADKRYSTHDLCHNFSFFIRHLSVSTTTMSHDADNDGIVSFSLGDRQQCAAINNNGSCMETCAHVERVYSKL